MAKETGLRVPLVVGTSSAKSLLVAGSLMMPGLIGPGLLPHLVRWAGIRPPGWVEVGVLIALPFALFIGLVHLLDAIKRLPRDVLLDGEGLRVLAGKRELHAWAELVPPFAELRHLTEKNQPGRVAPDKDEHELLLCKRYRNIPIANVTERWDIASFKSLAEAIRRLLRAKGLSRTLVSPKVAGAVRCEGCGVMMPPPSSPRETCTSCGHSQAIPRELLARVREARAVARHRRAAIENLFDARRCGRARFVVVTAIVVALTVWPAMMWLVYRAASMGLIGPMGALVALPVIPAVLSGMYYQLRVYLTDRIALHSVLLDADFFEAASRAIECGHCGAPLPPAEGLILECPHCSTDHILDYRGQHAMAMVLRSADAVEEMLATRERERRRWRLAASLTFAAALASSSGFALTLVFGRR